MENVNNFKNRSLSILTALAIAAAGYGVSSPANAYASSHTFGTRTVESIVDDQLYQREYNTYVVEEGDNASVISSKMISYFIKKGEVPKGDLEVFKEYHEKRCKYWPVIAMMNLNKNGNFRIHPGDEIIFPKSYEELKDIYASIMKSENNKDSAFVKYCRKNHIYKQPKVVYIDPCDAMRRVREVLEYTEPGKDICVDPDLVRAYLNTIGGRRIKYVYKDGAKLNKSQDFDFYEWILDLDEIIYPEEKQKTKTR